MKHHLQAPSSTLIPLLMLFCHTSDLHFFRSVSSLKKKKIDEIEVEIEPGIRTISSHGKTHVTVVDLKLKTVDSALSILGGVKQQ